jgi:hypothetical protein
MSDSRERRELDPVVARLIETEHVVVPPQPSLLREPPRALVAVGAIVAIASSPLPWAARTEIAGDESKTGWQGTADGFLIAFCAAVLIVLALNRSAVGSRIPIIRRLPAIFGVTVILLWFSGLRSMDSAIDVWRLQGYDGAYQPWLFICLIGCLMLAAGGVWLGSRPIPSEARPSKVRLDAEAEAVELKRVAVSGRAGRAGLDWIGVVAGAIVAVAAIVAGGIDRTAGSPGLVIGAVAGAIAGAAISRWIGERLASRTIRRP